MIDATTGVVGVKTLIWHIMPELHSSSVLKGVHRALEGSGASMDRTLINGRFTKTATVDLCCDILDKMSGASWQQWRQSSGPAFKNALRERVASVVSSGQVEQAHPPVQQAEEGVEKKAVVLRKALRAMNIEGSVRVDENTGMLSDIDVINMLCPGASPEDAAHMLTRVLEKEAAGGANNHGPTVHGPVALADRIKRIKINGKGNPYPGKRRPDGHRDHLAAPRARRTRVPQAVRRHHRARPRWRCLAVRRDRAAMCAPAEHRGRQGVPVCHDGTSADQKAQVIAGMVRVRHERPEERLCCGQSQEERGRD
ncbi:unnamed protein product [Ectocarpus sp. 6 AP-2014]